MIESKVGGGGGATENLGKVKGTNSRRQPPFPSKSSVW